MEVQDILDALNLFMLPERVEANMALPANPEEKAILDRLSSGPMHIDELTLACGLTAPTVSALLTMLELKGMVKAMGGMQFVKVK